jgi:hypothetical protein
MVVDVSRRSRDDDLGLVETGEIRDANGFSGLPPVTQATVTCFNPAASGRDHSLGPGQLGETAADRIGELVDLDEEPRRRIHRRATSGRPPPPMMVKVPRQLMTGSTPID